MPKAEGSWYQAHGKIMRVFTPLGILSATAVAQLSSVKPIPRVQVVPMLHHVTLFQLDGREFCHPIMISCDVSLTRFLEKIGHNEVRMPEMSYPAALDELIAFFESLPEGERRENLIDLAAQAAKHAPREGEAFDLEDVRKDAECTDTVGVHVRRGEDGSLHFSISLGPKVQTLTRALTTILCRGLNGCTPEQVIDVPQDFVPRIIGAELVRLRSQTVYYVLNRMKQAARRLAAAGE
jgi:cysteine desulfuration protein SufE